MRKIISLMALLSALMVVPTFVPTVSAQRPDIFVTPIPNNPFTATVNVHRLNIRADGSKVTFKNSREIGRDSRGRIFNENRSAVEGGSSESPAHVGMHIYDPETRVSTIINDQQHTFFRNTVNRPPEMVPPSFLSASSGLNTLPQNQFTKEEDLGNKTIDGLAVHGLRQTQNIPASASSKAAVITDEYWYSEDLRINLVVKHHDTRTGGVTLTVTGVNRAEPNPARFEVPEGYKAAGERQD
jgi:hypothetical protein